MRLLLFLLGIAIILCMGAPLVAAQDENAEANTEPVPYEQEEFATWLHSLRRFEIVTLGSFPLTYFFTLLVYDLYRFISESARIGNVNFDYAPLFFASPNKPPFTQDETIGLILASLSLSLIVGQIDLIIQETRRAEGRERAERRLEQATTGVSPERGADTPTETEAETTTEPSAEPSGESEAERSTEPSTEPATGPSAES